MTLRSIAFIAIVLVIESNRAMLQTQISTSKQVQNTLRRPSWLALRLDTDKCLEHLIQLLTVRSVAAVRPQTSNTP